MSTPFAQFEVAEKRRESVGTISLVLNPREGEAVFPGSDAVVSQQARELGVEAQPLSAFSTNAAPYNGLVLGFCNYSEPEIDHAVATLQGVLQKVMQAP